MTLDQALLYLETTARVSCPQITCDQAREIAELMRDLSWKTYAQVLRERDEAQAKLREVERERRAEIDCGQSDLCAKPPGCQRHWAERASELAKERDEARAKLREMEGERNAWFSVYEEAADDRERYAQTACGFAWDAGREMAALMAEVTKAERDALRAEMEALRLMPVEAAPDFDADDYAKPVKR